MIRGICKGAGRLALLAATMAFLTTVSLFLLSSFLMTWPILRRSPRDQRLKATADLASAAMVAMQVYGNRGNTPND